MQIYKANNKKLLMIDNIFLISGSIWKRLWLLGLSNKRISKGSREISKKICENNVIMESIAKLSIAC